MVSILAAGLLSWSGWWFGRAPLAYGAMLTGILLALGTGLYWPERFVHWLARWLWQWFLAPEGGQVHQPAPGFTSRPEDRRVQWLVLSVLALASGLVTVCAPLLVRMGGWTYSFLMERFLWTLTSRSLLQGAFGFALALWPLGLAGLCVRGVLHLAVCGERGGAVFVGALACGSGLGLAVSQGLGVTARVDSALIAAALPALLLAVVGAWPSRQVAGSEATRATGSARSDDSMMARECAALPVPASRPGRWGGLTYLLVLWLGLLIATQASLGVALLRLAEWQSATSVSVLLLAVGTGLWFGAVRQHTDGWLGRAGGWSAAAGAVSAPAVFSLIGWTEPAAALSSWVMACLFVALHLAGRSLACAVTLLLHQVTRPDRVAGAVIGRLLVLAALCAWIVVPLLVHGLGLPGTVALVSLLHLAAGGTCIIYEPAYPARTRQLRLGSVFACLLVLTSSLWWCVRGDDSPVADAELSASQDEPLEPAG
jgi:hypothetical protein